MADDVDVDNEGKATFCVTDGGWCYKDLDFLEIITGLYGGEFSSVYHKIMRVE